MSRKFRTKICGITRREDAELVTTLGAWALGFVFAKESPRRIPLGNVPPLIKGLPEGVLRVGVFVDATLDEIRAARDVGITVAQLHGFVPKDLAASAPIPYFIARAPSRLEELEVLAGFSQADAILIDGHMPGKMGGTGVTADWGLATQAKRFHPRIILAGGIKTENVLAAIQTVSPYAIDASSSLESSFGIKDPAKLRKFFESLPEME